MKIYIKLVMASSCYFCCPAGKKKNLCSKLVINSLQKKYFCMHMCACMCVSVSKYTFINELLIVLTTKDPELII